MTDKKCPKCGSRNFQISDYFTRAYIYEVKDGIVEAEGIGEESEHVRTICVCRDCNHQWHPKRFEYSIDK
jgi:Zn finger protein HypA/HybF involved in hydrogenase expression